MHVGSLQWWLGVPNAPRPDSVSLVVEHVQYSKSQRKLGHIAQMDRVKGYSEAHDAAVHTSYTAIPLRGSSCGGGQGSLIPGGGSTPLLHIPVWELHTACEPNAVFVRGLPWNNICILLYLFLQGPRICLMTWFCTILKDFIKVSWLIWACVT